MAVRYANLIGLSQEQHAGVAVFANRGTSGIDGSNSTAVGSALASDRLTVLVTGDMAFFYDRNAFWHNYRLPNLRVVLLNNHGGGIFRSDRWAEATTGTGGVFRNEANPDGRTYGSGLWHGVSPHRSDKI